MQGIVVASVFIFLPDAPADLETQLRGNGHITTVKKGVQVAPEQESIAWVVWPALAVWLNMGRLKHRQCSLGGNGAAALVKIGYQDSESALPQTRKGQHGSAITFAHCLWYRRHRRHFRDCFPTDRGDDPFPHTPTFA